MKATKPPSQIKTALKDILSLYKNEQVDKLVNDLVAIGTWPTPEKPKVDLLKGADGTVAIDTVPLPERPKYLKAILFQLIEQAGDLKLGEIFYGVTKNNSQLKQLKKLEKEPDYTAPDGSKIFLLPNMDNGGACICELPKGKTSKAIYHKTVEEIWYFLSGKGQVWRSMNEENSNPVEVTKDMSITIPVGCHFQFRNTGDEPLKFLIATMPPWPGENEAVFVKGYWK